MRLREILAETPKRSPMRKSASNAIPGLNAYDSLDNNNHPYMAYRFGVAMAGCPDHEDMAAQGPIGSAFTIIDYTDGDREIREKTEKMMGVKKDRSTSNDSKEIDIINKTSPIAKRKTNRYGV